MAVRKKIVSTKENKKMRSQKIFDVAPLSATYISLLYGALTLVVIFAIILLGVYFFSQKHFFPRGTISDQAASTVKNIPSNKPTGLSVQKQTVTPALTPAPTENAIQDQPQTYVVQSGDSLWTIAQKIYNSGYNWVSIARANNLKNPNEIYTGNSLLIPKVEAIIPVVTNSYSQGASAQPSQNTPSTPQSITGNSYIVQSGDNLWQIAVRAYGDGYKWVDLARVNSLSRPDIIFSGNQLAIPR